MKRVAQLVMCCLLVQCAFARSGGGGHGGGGGGGMRGGGGFSGGGSSGFRGGGFVGGRGGYYGGYGYGRGYYGGFGFGLGFGAYAPWYYGGYYGSYYDPYSYNPYYYPQTYVDPAPPAMVYQNPNYVPDPPVRPMIRDYPENAPPQSRATSEPTVYLIAFQDGSIQAALAYWVDGNTLHYVSTRREQREAPLESVDRALSQRLNRERRLELHLP